MKILFFIGTLSSGGKARRLLELLTYLKQKSRYSLFVVLAFESSYYPYFKELKVEHKVIGKKPNFKDPSVFLTLKKICKGFKPDIIHTWGSMQTFYMIPSSLFYRTPLVNSQITSAPPSIKKLAFSYIVNKLNFMFSTVILANSYAGLAAYRVQNNPKSSVIYNGINLDRFKKLPSETEIKKKYDIKTPFAVVMVASFTKNKNYDLFYKIADVITNERNDITFIGAGGYSNDSTLYSRIKRLAESNKRIILPGKIYDVEALINYCDVGILFSPYGEGISNSIMEYMAAGKPVIANDAGGTKEILKHNQNGYLINNENAREIADLIIELIEDDDKRKSFGEKSREIIENYFTIDRMGKQFEALYEKVLR